LPKWWLLKGLIEFNWTGRATTLARNLSSHEAFYIYIVSLSQCRQAAAI
jgi:hypothetical protein